MAGVSKKLQALSKEVLIALVADLSGRYDDIDQIIEAYLVAGQSTDQDGSAAHARKLHIVNKIEELTTTRSYYSYHEAHLFSQPCVRVLQDIERLAETDLEQALEALDFLLERHEKLFERLDDSDGVISELMYEAERLWLDIATRLRRNKPHARDWLADVMRYYNFDSGYFCFDALLGNSGDLLTDEELYKLAGQFDNEAQAVQDPQTNHEDRQRLNCASHGLCKVAKALQNLALYERSVLLVSPVPDARQLEQIIRFALNVKDFDRADYWLQQPQLKEDQYRYTSLANTLLEQQGNIRQLKINLLEEWRKFPTLYRMRDYWKYAESCEQKQITAELMTQMEQLNDKDDVVGMLLLTGQTKTAASYFIERYTSFSRTYYTSLLDWLAEFEQDGQILAVIVCYRLLLLDILERGFSRAYHHAAHYFNSLLALDKARPDYGGLKSAREFITELQVKHGRKRSFWKEAGYPAK